MSEYFGLSDECLFDALGEDRFFELVRTMPSPVEAYNLCAAAHEHYKKGVNRGLPRHKQEAQRVCGKLSKEMKIINVADDKQRTREIITELWGDDGWAMYRARMIETDPRFGDGQ